QETGKLRNTTEDLRRLLASSQTRGQWGERMVEDILNYIGLQENINYTRQTTVESGERPDYTFFLPKGKKVNMDVKFPLTHYERYLHSESPDEQGTEKSAFLKDVKNHLKAISKREYINPSDGTVDYVMMFIPNESIYGFINKEDPDMIGEALSNHIMLCSPITLYAVLSLLRQATENFMVEQKANEIMTQVSNFKKQWDKFSDQMDSVGKALDQAISRFQTLTSTRSRMLEKPVNKIMELQQTTRLEAGTEQLSLESGSKNSDEA
ncbi:MAG: DNA recombination protein RmuC, partial [Lentisphaeria bacterium]|nr:DNA recombination protein RmuC [Lentisphaeria bacterium]